MSARAFKPQAAILREPDGFSIEVDEQGERADIILDRPPMNIVSIHERDQLCAAFAELDAHPGVRVIVLRGAGENFSSGGKIAGFLALQGSLAALILLSLWSVFRGTSDNYRKGERRDA